MKAIWPAVVLWRTFLRQGLAREVLEPARGITTLLHRLFDRVLVPVRLVKDERNGRGLHHRRCGSCVYDALHRRTERAGER